MKNKKILFFNDKKYNSKLEDMNFIKYKAQQIINNYYNLGIGTLNTMNDLKRLLYSTKYYLHEKSLETNFFGIDSLKKIDEIIKMVDTFFKILENRTLNVNDSFEINISKNYLLGYFEFNESGYLQIKETVIENLRTENGIYANSERAQKLFDFSTKLVSLINENDILNSVKIIYDYSPLGQFIESLIKVNQSTQKAEINITTIKFYDF